MDNGFSRGIRAAAVIAVVVAAALVCTAAGTLAAFSATYTWSSDTATSGNFPYADTEYSISLFDGAAEIMPGDWGSAVLEGPSFDGYDVAWTFSESNEATLPVVFYLRDGDGAMIAGTAYSKFDFSSLADTFVYADGGQERLSLFDVSSDVTGLVAAIGVGAELCWIWPQTFYAEETGGTPVDSAATDAYAEICRSLCSRCAFDAALSAALDGHVVGFVTGKEGDVLTWQAGEDADYGFTVTDGLPYACGKECHVYTAGTFAPASSVQTTLYPDAEVWLFVPSSVVDEITTAAQGAGLSQVLTEAGNYIFPDGTQTAVPDAGGDRTLLKAGVSVLPHDGHKLSVTVTATVSA